MEITSNETNKTSRFTKKQIATIAVRVAVVGGAIAGLAYVSHKMKHQNDES